AEAYAEGFTLGLAEGMLEVLKSQGAMNLDLCFWEWEHKKRAQGKADALLIVLEGLGVSVTAAQRTQLLARTDQARLTAWLRALGTSRSPSAVPSTGGPRPQTKRTPSSKKLQPRRAA